MKKFYIFIMLTIITCTSCGEKTSSMINTDKSYIRTMPGVSTKMLKPEFWIDKDANADKIIMSINEIEDFNLKIRERIKFNKYFSTSPDSFPEEIKREELITLICPKEEDFRKNKLYYRGNIAGRDYFDKILTLVNIDAIKSIVRVRYAICTEYAKLRSKPTNEVLYKEEAKNRDVLQYFSLNVNERILLLHTSFDGKWYFCVTNYGMGWIETENIGMCRNRKEWENAEVGDNFLQVNCESFIIKPQQMKEGIGSKTLYMGTRLKLVDVENAKKQIDSRYYYDNYVVKYPVRDELGFCSYQFVLIPINEDVSIGYIPYTTENVIRQSFKFLGDIYGWGNMHTSKDCSSMVHIVFSCFGFNLPRNSTMQRALDSEKIELLNLDIMEKKSVLNKLPSGTLLGFPGHIMIYLGMDYGMYYVISATGSCIPYGENESKEVSTIMITELESTMRSNKNTWFNELTEAIYIKN